MSEPTEPAENAGDRTAVAEPTPQRRSRLGVRLFGLALVVASVVLATYLLVAYLAFESGRELQVQQETAARSEQLDRQIELARQDLAEGSTHLALTRLDWVLAQDAGHADALALREEAQAADVATRQPEPTTAPRPTAEATPETADAGEVQTELQTIRRLVAGEQWAEALPLLTSFQQRFPDDRRQETDQLLFDTLVGLGLSLVNTEKVELGLNYFSQAERLGMLPPEVEEYRIWADLYFEGVAYSGVNWAIATDYWRDLCAAAPFYQDACSRLHRALVGWGDQLAYALDWCPAVGIYQQAWNQSPNDTLGGKLAQARDGCAAATPIPITGTIPLTGSAPITGTNPLTSTEPGG